MAAGEPMVIPQHHAVLNTPLTPPFPSGIEQVLFGMGCFWGAERLFWQLAGVYTTAVGYSGGNVVHPDYELVCSGGSGHSETVLVAYDAAQIDFTQLLCCFWQGHDPTQGMRQGNDVGTQYRSGIYSYTAQQFSAAKDSKEKYQQALTVSGMGVITTEIQMAAEFYYAEAYHQQYLQKNPQGYCGLGGTGISFPSD